MRPSGLLTCHCISYTSVGRSCGYWHAVSHRHITHPAIHTKTNKFLVCAALSSNNATFAGPSHLIAGRNTPRVQDKRTGWDLLEVHLSAMLAFTAGIKRHQQTSLLGLEQNI